MDKAYIVANEEQEREVLEKLYKKGIMWPSSAGNGNYWSPVHKYVEFPYVITDDEECLIWTSINRLTDEEIVFDGRKEEKMSEKYVVSQEFMNELEEWKDTLTSNDDEYKPLVSWVNIKNLPETVYMWLGDDVPDKENNNRLIAIIRWVNGEDVFEVEKPKKWVVRSKDSDLSGDYWYVHVYKNLASTRFNEDQATHFNTKEEAESWANSHQEVVEVVDV